MYADSICFTKGGWQEDDTASIWLQNLQVFPPHGQGDGDWDECPNAFVGSPNMVSETVFVEKLPRLSGSEGFTVRPSPPRLRTFSYHEPILSSISRLTPGYGFTPEHLVNNLHEIAQ